MGHYYLPQNCPGSYKMTFQSMSLLDPVCIEECLGGPAVVVVRQWIHQEGRAFDEG